MWKINSTQKASIMLKQIEDPSKEGDHPFFSYLRKLREIAGKPKNGIFHKETLKEYVARALQEAAKKNRLEDVTLK
jgi:hypothetical protein